MQTPAEEYGLQEAWHILSPLGRTFNLLSWGTAPFQVVQLKDMHLPAFYSHTARTFKRREWIWSKWHYADLQVWYFSTPMQATGPAIGQMWFKCKGWSEEDKSFVLLQDSVSVFKAQNGVYASRNSIGLLYFVRRNATKIFQNHGNSALHFHRHWIAFFVMKKIVLRNDLNVCCYQTLTVYTVRRGGLHIIFNHFLFNIFMFFLQFRNKRRVLFL